MIILAIETSCDDTCLAVLKIARPLRLAKQGGRENWKLKILSNFVSSQVKIHAPFGGVVPHLAARAHYRNLLILLEKILLKINPQKIDLIAVTIGPGLEPSLWAGIRFARLLALSLKKPIIGVNHLEGHIFANFVGENPKSQIPNLKSLFPAICLIVSGGHTQLVLINGFEKYQVIGQTRDDAAGEAFDKVAKLLNLGYPGGPIISEVAKKGSPFAFDLPRPMIHSQDYDFSFSGLKTAVLYLLRTLSKEQIKKLTPAICAEFQQAVVDVLVSKTIRAAKEYQVKSVILTGGVAANSQLRKQMGQAVKSQIPNGAQAKLGRVVGGLESQFLVPDVKFCTDNGAMIALAGYLKYSKKGPDKLKKITAFANLNL